MKFTTKIYLFIFSLLIISFCSLSGLGYWKSSKDLELHLGKRLEHIAGTGSLLINAEDHQKFIATI